MCVLCVCVCFLTANEYGLFKPDEDPTKGRWLEQGRTLEYYHLKSGVSHATPTFVTHTRHLRGVRGMARAGTSSG